MTTHTTLRPAMNRQLSAFFTMLGGALATLIALGRGDFAWAIGWGILTAVAYAAARIWSRKDPGPMPYLMRWILLAPRPYQSPRQLQRILEAQRGERILEVGAGIGVHALPVAAAVGPDGIVDALDVQQAMLDELMQRATSAGIIGIVATRADARKLPFGDHTFDAAYLISVLGEVPDQDLSLAELRRVLKPNGRLVIGEFFIDPDFVTRTELQHRMGRAGFTFERTSGLPLAYFARFKTT